MKIFKDFNSKEIAEILDSGGVGVIPTDTIYGVVAKALDGKAVEKIYEIKDRNSKKPLIVLIGSFFDLEKFKVSLSAEKLEFLQKHWPGKVSVILPVERDKFEYLHRGANSIAFRFSNDSELVGLIQETGPLVAPSANPEGQKPAKDIDEAIDYFGENADFYVDGGILESEPSTLVDFTGASHIVLRKGEEI